MTTRRSAEWPTLNPALIDRPSVEGVEVLGGAGPVPRHAGLEGLERHALDPGQHAHEVVAVGGVVAERGDGEAAVAADDRGDAVQRRRRQRGVPEHLRVEVGVDVDEAGRDDLAGGVDALRRLGVGEVGDGGDAVADDADIGAPTRRVGAVDHVAAGDDDVEHGASPWGLADLVVDLDA